jgi:hypothetical protein
MRNRFFNQYSTASEQNVLEDLIIESIKVYGIDAYYLPKTFVNLDLLYKEDTSLIYDDALPLELHLKTFDGYLGQNDFISKFGLQIDESMTFTLAKKRFLQVLQPKLMTEHSYNLINEDGTGLVQDVEGGYDYSTYIRPLEGDLIWFPFTNDLFEIKFVEIIETLFQLGKLYTFELRCDKYEYTSDKLETGLDEIDQIEDIFSVATDNFPTMLLEDDTQLLNEDGTIFLQEGNNVQSKDAGAQNEFIQSQIGDEDILDFSEKNPFAQTRIF